MEIKSINTYGLCDETARSSINEFSAKIDALSAKIDTLTTQIQQLSERNDVEIAYDETSGDLTIKNIGSDDSGNP